jgi:putative FmdB family regulatory protein
MPTYTYRREDGTTFETQQRITEDALDECPETGQSVERIITGSPGVITDSAESSGATNSTGAPTCSGPLCGL